MLQRWHEITFCHWSCTRHFLQDRLPDGLEVDTFEGNAWISLTPFLLTGFRPPLLPRALGFSFPETNLRTYVTGPEGPGIWFFSLDAGRLLPVWGARMTFGLPYFWADMKVQIGDSENLYTSKRVSGSANALLRIAKESPIVEQSELDIFLTARFRLSSTYGRWLIAAEVEPPPWELN